MFDLDNLDSIECEPRSPLAESRDVLGQSADSFHNPRPHVILDDSCPQFGRDNAPDWQWDAQTVYDHGWDAIFPQERSGERKPIVSVKPSRLHHWSVYPATTQSGLEIARMGAMGSSADERRHMLDHSPYRANVAMVLGRHSASVEALDLDVSDPDRLARVKAFALRILGPTPFMRVGRAPREMWFYRRPDDGTRSRWTLPIGGDDAVEFLTQGSTVTLLGRHYRTGKSIQWIGAASPLCNRPEEAPVVTWEQVEAFKSAIAVEFGVARNRRVAREAVRVDMDDTGTRVPPGWDSVPGCAYDPVTCKLIDGRDNWLYRRARRWMHFNRSWDEARLAYALADEARERFAEWEEKFADEAQTKVRAALAELASGKIRYARIREDEDGSITELGAVGASSCETSSGIEVLLPPPGRVGKELRVVDPGKPCPVKAAERALIKDRAAVTDRVYGEILGTIRGWMGNLYAGLRDNDAVARSAMDTVRVLKGPTGSGKTVSIFKVLCETKRERGSFGGALLMTAPTHENLREMKSKAEAAALNAGVDLRVAILKGAKEGGCLLGDVREVLSEHDVGAENLCFKKGEHGAADMRCVHYDTCPVIANRKEAAGADLIFAPDAFVAVRMPKAVHQAVAGVVMDERWWDKIAKSTSFPVSVFDTPRGQPAVTGPEKRLGITADDLSNDRDEACRIVLAAFMAGDDWADALDAYDVTHPSGIRVTGVDLCVSARKVAVRTADRHRRVQPNMTIEGARYITSAAVSAFAFQEARFWSIAEDRLRSLRADRLHRDLAASSTVPCNRRETARGAVDARVQLLDPDREWANTRTDMFRPTLPDGPTVRISWRIEPNFSKLPVMLLDASASERIVRKLFPGRPVDMIEVTAPLHMRTVLMLGSTMSDRSLVPRADGTRREALWAARNAVQLRRIATKISALNGHSRMAFCANKSVKESLADGWGENRNIDLMHYGATRGLDFARHHDAAMSVGRMELPARAIDGLVAAFTYDDDEPEMPIDRHGTGKVKDAKGAWVDCMPEDVERTYKARDGRDVVVKVPEWPGPWAKIVQAQYREEELLQFAGRLRPVYRETDREPPVYVCVSKVCHPDLIVDEFVSLDDLAVDSDVWEGVRRKGVLDHRICRSTDLDDHSIRALAADLAGKPLAHDPRAKGLIRYAYFEVGSDVERHVLMPASDPTPMETVWALLYGNRFVDRERGLRLVDAGAEASRATPRPTDVKFEQRVGTWQDRRDAEERHRIDEVVHILATHDADAMSSPSWAKKLRAEDDKDSEVYGEKVSLDVRIRLKRGRRIGR